METSAILRNQAPRGKEVLTIMEQELGNRKGVKTPSFHRRVRLDGISIEGIVYFHPNMIQHRGALVRAEERGSSFIFTTTAGFVICECPKVGPISVGVGNS